MHAFAAMARSDFNKLIAQLEDVKTSIEELRDRLTSPEDAEQLDDAEQTIQSVTDALEELNDKKQA